jgi:hypothetical protein
MQRKEGKDIKGAHMLSRKHFCVMDRAVLGCKQKKNNILKNDGFCKNY